ncbi:hypothetical protein AMTRI_Chr04g242420 [Amborella trichopoda]
MKEQFACEYLHQYDWMGENGGKGHDKRGHVSTIRVEEGLRKGNRGTVGSASGKRERDVRRTVACYFNKTRGRPEGRTPSVTGLERQAAITCSQGGLDKGQGTRSYVASPEKRKLRSRDR